MKELNLRRHYLFGIKNVFQSEVLPLAEHIMERMRVRWPPSEPVLKEVQKKNKNSNNN